MGSLWFDSDTDNDNAADSFPKLSAAWNPGPGLPSAGQSDLYSTALHEMMHAIGFGFPVTWNSLSDPRIAGITSLREPAPQGSAMESFRKPS